MQVVACQADFFQERVSLFELLIGKTHLAEKRVAMLDQRQQDLFQARIGRIAHCRFHDSGHGIGVIDDAL